MSIRWSRCLAFHWWAAPPTTTPVPLRRFWRGLMCPIFRRIRWSFNPLISGEIPRVGCSPLRAPSWLQFQSSMVRQRRWSLGDGRATPEQPAMAVTTIASSRIAIMHRICTPARSGPTCWPLGLRNSWHYDALSGLAERLRLSFSTSPQMQATLELPPISPSLSPCIRCSNQWVSRGIRWRSLRVLMHCVTALFWGIKTSTARMRMSIP